MTAATEVNTQLTPAAEAFIRRLCRFAAGPEAGFRLKVARGGCSGFAAEFDLVGEPAAGDFIWEYDGLRIFLDAGSRKLLEDATVDFRETLSQVGFVITTPGGTPEACGAASRLVSIEPTVRC
jgi:iron-sulfur cluster assembly protein